MRIGRPIGLAIFLALLLGGCALSPDDFDPEDRGLASRIADQFIDVEDDQRPLRVCLLATAAIEIMTDRVRLFDGAQAEVTLGRLLALQGVVDIARGSGGMWRNADMADVAFLFSRVLIDAGESRLARILLGGVTISGFLDTAKRAAVTTAKGNALLRDIQAMFAGLKDTTYQESELWAACESRAARNRETLKTLTRARL